MINKYLQNALMLASICVVASSVSSKLSSPIPQNNEPYSRHSLARRRSLSVEESHLRIQLRGGSSEDSPQTFAVTFEVILAASFDHFKSFQSLSSLSFVVF